MKRRCPVCRQPIGTSGKQKAEDTKFFPFCSQRCKLIDLGAWLDAEYRIFSQQPSDEPAKPPDAPSPSDDQ